jgi:O-antigen/teichoic acid export membrane protein
VLGSGFAVVIRFGQTILLTRYLAIDDYGRVLIVLNFFVFLDSFFGLRVSDVMFRFFQPLLEHDEHRTLRHFLLFCFKVCLVSGVLIYLGVFVLSPWLASWFYSSAELSPLFKVYGLTILVSAFSGIYEPVLRMHDRFSGVVVPQLLGGLTTLTILFIYLGTTGRTPYDLRIIVAAFAIGGLLQTIPPFIQSLRLLRPLIAQATTSTDVQTPPDYRRDLFRCLFNSNLSGYLKFAVSPGDVFLLGIFSSPTQVALYGLAKQLTSPLALLQTTIQTAITPEITTLIARSKLRELQQLVKRYVTSALAIGGVLLLCAVIIGRLLILHAFDPQYESALPVFYCLAVAAWLLLVFLVFRPLALTLDLLPWHNAALLLSAIIVVSLIIAGRLDALRLAYVQLAEALVLRFAFSLVVWKALRDRSGNVTTLLRRHPVG